VKELTKAEEQVMQHIWKLEKAFLKDVVKQFDEPRPATTTVSTVIRVLVKKGFLAYKTYSKVHEYYPLISKNDYIKTQFKKTIKSFFNGSISKFASFFTNNEDLTISELEEIKKMIEDRLNEKKYQQ